MAFGQVFLRARSSMGIEVDWDHLAQRGRDLFERVSQIEATARTGRVDWEKSRELPDKPYDKFFLSRYFGKEETTYELVLLYQRMRNQGQVMTVWVRRGRRSRRRRRLPGASRR